MLPGAREGVSTTFWYGSSTSLAKLIGELRPPGPSVAMSMSHAPTDAASSTGVEAGIGDLIGAPFEHHRGPVAGDELGHAGNDHRLAALDIDLHEVHTRELPDEGVERDGADGECLRSRRSSSGAAR